MSYAENSVRNREVRLQYVFVNASEVVIFVQLRCAGLVLRIVSQVLYPENGESVGEFLNGGRYSNFIKGVLGINSYVLQYLTIVHFCSF